MITNSAIMALIICWPFVGETGPRVLPIWERDDGYCLDRLRNLVIPAAVAEGHLTCSAGGPARSARKGARQHGRRPAQLL
jgi:hypothetical protein